MGNRAIITIVDRLHIRYKFGAGVRPGATTLVRGDKDLIPSVGGKTDFPDGMHKSVFEVILKVLKQ
jgi:hypothetical protein